MEMYLIRDSNRGIYYIKGDEPFFYAFSTLSRAKQFCNSNSGTEIETQEIYGQEDTDYIMSCMYQRGYKGGYIDGKFEPLNFTNPELMKLIPENAGLLHLILFRQNRKKKLLQSQRFYLFAMITDEGYLAFANSNGYIFSFTDVENIDTGLSKQLYQRGYETVRCNLDAHHKYIINPGKVSQTMLEEDFIMKIQ